VREAKRNVLVGIFMIGGLGVLGTLMVLFGEQPAWLGGAEYRLTIDFRKLEGVSEGMEIYLNGLQVGRVGSLEFSDPERPDLGVKVVGLIKDKYYIPSGARAVVYPSLLGIGRGHIELVVPPIETEPLDREFAAIVGEVGSPFEDLFPDTLLFSVEKSVQQIGNLAEAATPVATDLHHLFEKRTVADVDQAVAEAAQITATLYTVVERFDHTLRHVNEVLGDPATKSAVREAIENFRQASEDGRVMMANLRGTSEHLDEDLDHLSGLLENGLTDAHTGINEIRQRLLPTLDTLAKLAENLNRVALDLAEGQGTAGLFLRDPRLYEALLLSAERITDAVDTIRRIADRFEKQGFIDLKVQDAVGPLPARTRREIPK